MQHQTVSARCMKLAPCFLLQEKGDQSKQTFWIRQCPKPDLAHHQNGACLCWIETIAWAGDNNQPDNSRGGAGAISKAPPSSQREGTGVDQGKGVERWRLLWLAVRHFTFVVPHHNRCITHACSHHCQHCCRDSTQRPGFHDATLGAHGTCKHLLAHIQNAKHLMHGSAWHACDDW